MKKELGQSVYEAAKERISWTFDNFQKIYISFSGGKDSTVMFHLVMAEAIKRNQKIGVLFVDLEGQYKLTINHIKECLDMYSNYIVPHWVCIPIKLRNAVSQFEPRWICWDGKSKEDWVRDIPDIARTDYPFVKSDMEFEEFVPAFGEWFGDGELTACFVGIRTDESLNRWRTIANKNKSSFKSKAYTTKISENLYNVYPVYDWKTKDIWIFHSKNKNLPYNKLYDRMYQAGLTIHQMRICQPYGDDQRKGLWLFHIIEPETWGKIVARVNGANQGALYAKETGNILGRIKVNKPEGHTWKSFAYLLLESQPLKLREHFKNKIAVFLNYWKKKGYDEIPDEAEHKEEAEKTKPSWRRICKALLKNDYWCKSLSFSQTKSEAYKKYIDLMKRRRQEWKII